MNSNEYKDFLEWGIPGDVFHAKASLMYWRLLRPLYQEQKDNLAWAQREILTTPVGIVMEVQLNTGS